MEYLKSLNAIVMLDVDGKRLLVKNYDQNTNSTIFEKKLFLKTKGHKMNEELLNLDRMLVIHRFFADFHLYVIGHRNQNPIVLESISECLIDVMKMLTTKVTLELEVIETYKAQLMLALDEICDDNGFILETDPNLVHSRITFKTDASEPTMVQKLQNASELIRFPWARS